MSYNNKWGISRRTFKKLSYYHGKTFDPPHKTDGPDRCVLGEHYWHNYPYRDYTYVYNQWGFRSHDGQDYHQHLGKEVNICIGDSCTLNLGGPIEHSYPYLLSKYFDIPTLNYGIDDLCFYDFNELLTKVKQDYKVRRIFVLYNMSDNDRVRVEQWEPLFNNVNVHTRLQMLKSYCWVDGAYWQFDPPWVMSPLELVHLYEQFPEAHDYLKTVPMSYKQIDYNLLVNIANLKQEYYKIAGKGWIPYEQFCQYLLLGEDVSKYYDAKIDKELIKGYLFHQINPAIKQMILTNRDIWHMSKLVNQHLADYFYKKVVEREQYR